MARAYGTRKYIYDVRAKERHRIILFTGADCLSSQVKLTLIFPTMKVFIVLAVLVAAAVAQYAPTQDIPIPYSFSYAADTEDGGQSSHQESGDGAGRVTGSYTVNDLEGHTRVVDYIADENGFRANIRTNEPGTANINPADVSMESSAIDVSGVSTYSMGAGPAAIRTAPVAPVAPIAPVAPAGRAGVRYVLVPVNDPRARGYY